MHWMVLWVVCSLCGSSESDNITNVCWTKLVAWLDWNENVMIGENVSTLNVFLWGLETNGRILTFVRIIGVALTKVYFYLSDLSVCRRVVFDSLAFIRKTLFTSSISRRYWPVKHVNRVEDVFVVIYVAAIFLLTFAQHGWFPFRTTDTRLLFGLLIAIRANPSSSSSVY